MPLNKIKPMKKLLLFAFAALAFSCSSDDDSSNDGGGGSDVAYIRGKMNNVAFDYTFNNVVDDEYLYNAGSGFSGNGFDRWYYYGGNIAAFNPPSFAPVFYISWNNMYFGQNGDEAGETAAFYDTVSDLPSNYLTNAQDDNHLPGLDISYESADGTYYSTRDGVQTGSTLTIDGSSEEIQNGQQLKTVWGKFTCKLYNQDDPTDMIQVTEGKFKLILTDFQ